MSDQPGSMPLREISPGEFTPELLSAAGEALSRSTLFAPCAGIILMRLWSRTISFV